MRTKLSIATKVARSRSFLKLTREARDLYLQLLVDADGTGIVENAAAAQAISQTGEEEIEELTEAGFIIPMEEEEEPRYVITHTWQNNSPKDLSIKFADLDQAGILITDDARYTKSGTEGVKAREYFEGRRKKKQQKPAEDNQNGQEQEQEKKVAQEKKPGKKKPAPKKEDPRNPVEIEKERQNQEKLTYIQTAWNTGGWRDGKGWEARGKITPSSKNGARILKVMEERDLTPEQVVTVMKHMLTDQWILQTGADINLMSSNLDRFVDSALAAEAAKPAPVSTEQEKADLGFD